MTRPAEIKPREGAQPGTAYAEFELGVDLPVMAFTLTPEIHREYAHAVDANPEGYEIDGRRAGLPSVLAVYLLAILYRKYPPIQGIVLTDVKFRFLAPLWIDKAVRLKAYGTVDSKIEKRGKKYVQWSAEFVRADDDRTVCIAQNSMYLPE